MKALNHTNTNLHISNCYKEIALYNSNNENNKLGVVFTPVDVAKDMIALISPTIQETILEPSVGSGVFIVALIEYIIEKYTPTAEELQHYMENKVYFADIDKSSVDFTINLISNFMAKNCEVDRLSINGLVKDSLYNENHYDIVVGNPPYIRTKNLAKKYLQFLRNRYTSCSTGNVDIYYAFIEMANMYSSRSALIVPRSYLTNTSAQLLRNSIKTNVFYIRDFKMIKKFSKVGTYTTILMLETKANSSSFLYAEENRKACSYPREILSASVWDVNKFSNKQAYEHRDTKLSDIANVYCGINTNADKYFILDKSTLENGFYKQQVSGKEFLIEKEICIDFIKVSKLFSTNLNQVVIFPYVDTNVIIPEAQLSKNYPNTYKYFKFIKPLLAKRDKGKTNNYDSWYAYGRRQGINNDFSGKTSYLIPIVYKENNFKYQKHKPLYRFLHNSGFVIVPKYGWVKELEQILKSKDFQNYLLTYGTTMPGSTIEFNKVTAKILKNYPYLICQAIVKAA
jgi:hypothetical protein